MLTRQPQGSLPIQNESRVDAWEREGNKRRGCNVELEGLLLSDCCLSIFCTTTGEGERDDGEQEGGWLKRQMKGQHIEGKRDVTTGSISDRERDQRVNEWKRSREREGGRVRRTVSEYRAQNWQTREEKGSNSVLHLGEEGAPRTKQFILSCYWRQRKGQEGSGAPREFWGI